MRNVSDKSCSENQNFFFFFENFALYDMMWKNRVEPDRAQMTIWRFPIECWIPKATNTHSECVILVGFPRQPWLHERPSMLGHTYIACRV